jgi:hypothetical protein
MPLSPSAPDFKPGTSRGGCLALAAQSDSDHALSDQALFGSEDEQDPPVCEDHNGSSEVGTEARSSAEDVLAALEA